MMNSILDSFFCKSFENEINFQLLEHEYAVFSCETEKYVKNLISVPISEYLHWIDGHFLSISLSVEDVVQYSNLEDAKIKVVKKLIENGDNGFTILEIGQMLQDDGVERKTGAYRKYGENHAKLARYLGYVFSMNRYYYVSLLGHASESLPEDEKDALFVRLFVRTPLFRVVYLLSHRGVVDMRALFDFLSDTTYKRRRGNVSYLFKFTEIVEKGEVDIFKMLQF